MKHTVSVFALTNLCDSCVDYRVGCGVTFDVTSNSKDEFLTDILKVCLPFVHTVCVMCCSKLLMSQKSRGTSSRKVLRLFSHGDAVIRVVSIRCKENLARWFGRYDQTHLAQVHTRSSTATLSQVSIYYAQSKNTEASPRSTQQESGGEVSLCWTLTECFVLYASHLSN